MNREASPESLILRALASPDLRPEARAIAIDFLSGDRSSALENRAYEIYDRSSKGLDNRVGLLVVWWSGVQRQEYEGYRNRAINELQQTLESMNL